MEKTRIPRSDRALSRASRSNIYKEKTLLVILGTAASVADKPD